MARKDDFTLAVKKTIAQRSGYRCAFPGCGRLTEGPSSMPAKTISDGMACHIAAASSGPGAKRYNRRMTSAQRQSVDNGIWMCYTHGKLIDTDENRFNVKLLKSWKKIAESLTSVMVEQGCQYETARKSLEGKGLLINSIKIVQRKENELIGNALMDSCIELFWGKEITDAIRDYLIEFTRNAIIHGGATDIELNVSSKFITICDNGKPFSSQELLDSQKGRGGAKSLKRLQGLNAPLVMLTETLPTKNETKISLLKESSDILSISHCSIELKAEDLYRYGIPVEVKVPTTCNEFFVVLPNYFSYSDIGLLHNLKIDSEKDKIKVVFIPNNISAGILETMKIEFPDFTFLNK